MALSQENRATQHQREILVERLRSDKVNENEFRMMQTKATECSETTAGCLAIK